MAGDRFARPWRNIAFFDDAAPGDVIGQLRCDVGQELRAHGGVNPVGGNQQVAPLPSAVFKDCGDASPILLDPDPDSFPGGRSIPA